MWVYIAVAAFIAFAIYKERQALGCPNIPTGEDCDNRNGKAVKGTTPDVSDSLSTLYEKIVLAANFPERWVMWRVAVIVAVISAVLLWYILFRSFPGEWELMTMMISIGFVVYSTFHFYKFHLMQYATDNITHAVNIIESKTKSFTKVW